VKKVSSKEVSMEIVFGVVVAGFVGRRRELALLDGMLAAGASATPADASFTPADLIEAW
jgi:hypothetical protein